MNGVIYHAFDTTNGKAYVGQTWDFPERFYRHHLPKREQFLFDRSLQKRPDKFVWTTLLELSTQEDLNVAEASFIKELGTRVPNGYNLTEGGKNGRHCQETKDKIAWSNSDPDAPNSERLRECVFCFRIFRGKTKSKFCSYLCSNTFSGLQRRGKVLGPRVRASL